MRLKLARKETVQQVLVYHNEQYKDNKKEKLAFANGLFPDADNSSKSI